MAEIDRVCPPYVETALLTVRLRDALAVPRVGGIVDMLVDYSGASSYGGVMLPLDLVIVGPSDLASQRRAFARFVPRGFLWTPTEVGRYTVTVSERFHNRLRGSIVVNVLPQS